MSGVCLFAVPKAFRGLTGVQQTNAVQSWTRLGRDVEIILLGDDEGVADAAQRLSVRHIDALPRNELGTPLVNAAFRAAEEQSQADVMCYVNADIILLPDFVSILRQVQLRRFLVCGRRWDLDLREPLDFDDAAWHTTLRDRVSQHGYLHAADGIDYFAYSRGLYERVPPFAIGRTIWDNWLVFRARALSVPVVDATTELTIVHQNHDYSHLDGGLVGAWTGPEAMCNRRLASEMLYPFTIDDATHVLRSARLVPRSSLAARARLALGGIALRLRSSPAALRLVRKVLRAKYV